MTGTFSGGQTFMLKGLNNIEKIVYGILSVYSLYPYFEPYNYNSVYIVGAGPLISLKNILHMFSSIFA